MEIKIVGLVNQTQISTAMGNGRPLALKPEQRESARQNFATLVNTSKTMIQEVSEVLEAPAPTEPVVETFESVPQMETPQPEEIVVEPSAPVVASIPPVEVPSEPVAPVVEPVSTGVEIVSEPKETEFDSFIRELNEVDALYDQKIIDLNEERKAKKQEVFHRHRTAMEASYQKAKEDVAKAHDFMKNAQTAEQIAMIAHQNAMNNAQTADVPSVAPVMPTPEESQNAVSFPGVTESSFMAPPIPSIEDANVLQRVA